MHSDPTHELYGKIYKSPFSELMITSVSLGVSFSSNIIISLITSKRMERLYKKDRIVISLLSSVINAPYHFLIPLFYGMVIYVLVFISFYFERLFLYW